MKWWEVDFERIKESEKFKKLTGVWLELKLGYLVFHIPVNLFYLSYVLAKSSGKEQITYTLTGGAVLQIALSDVERVLSHIEKGEKPFSLTLVIDGKKREVVATPVKVPPSSDANTLES